MMSSQTIGENSNLDVVLEDEHNQEDTNEEDYEDDYGSSDKWKYSIYSALIFLIISSPYTYLLVNKLLGSFTKISSPTGCPTLIGLFIHAAVFALVIRGVMELDI